MPAKKSGCLRNFLAVLFTTLITPVLANVLTENVKDWQLALEGVLEGKSSSPTEWNRPITESVARPPHETSSFPSVNATAQPAPYRVPTPAGKVGQWHWAAGAWGQ